MNEACNSPIKTKKVSGRPDVPKNQATVGTVDYKKYTAINPASTPVSAYTKKIK